MNPKLLAAIALAAPYMGSFPEPTIRKKVPAEVQKAKLEVAEQKRLRKQAKRKEKI